MPPKGPAAAAPAAPKKVLTLRGILDNPSDAAEFLGIPQAFDQGARKLEHKRFKHFKDFLAHEKKGGTDFDKATALMKFALTTNCDVGQIGQLESMLRANTPPLAGAIDANKTFDVLNEAIKNRAGFLMLRKLVKEYKINPTTAPTSGQRNAIFTAISSGNFPATKFFFDNNYADFLKEYEDAFVALASRTDFTKSNKFQNLLLYAATNLDKERSDKLLRQLEVATPPNSTDIKAAVAAVKAEITKAQATGFAAQFNKGVDLAGAPKGVATSDHLLVEAIVTLALGKEVKSLTWNMQSKCYSHKDSAKRLLDAVTQDEIEAYKSSMPGSPTLSDEDVRKKITESKAIAQEELLATLQHQDLQEKKDVVIGYKNSPTNITETDEQYSCRRQEQIDYIIETLRNGRADYLNLQEAAGFINKATGEISQDLLARLQEIGYAATFSPSAKNLITIYDETKLKIVGEPQPHIYQSSDGGKTCSRTYSALAMSTTFQFKDKDNGKQITALNYHLNYGDKLLGQDWFIHPKARIAPEAGKTFTGVNYGQVLQELDRHLSKTPVVAMIASGDANRPSTEFRELENSQITEEVATNIESTDEPKELAKGTVSTNFSAAEKGKAKSYDAVLVFSAGGVASVELSKNNYSFQENTIGTKKVSVQPYSKAKGAAPAGREKAPSPPQRASRTAPAASLTSPAVVDVNAAARQPRTLGRAIAAAAAAAAMAALPQSPAAPDEVAPTRAKGPKAKPQAPKRELSPDKKLIEALKEILGENFGDKLEKDKKKENPLKPLEDYTATSKPSKAYDNTLNYLFQKKDSNLVIRVRINKNNQSSRGVSVVEKGFFSNKKLSEEDANPHLEELAQAIENLRAKRKVDEDDLEDTPPNTSPFGAAASSANGIVGSERTSRA